MGDRRQINFRDMGNLWYYTHWGGSSMMLELQQAIKFAQPRWDDHSYCFRIILSQLFKPIIDSVTGAGLDTMECETEYPPDPIVYIKTQRILWNKEEYTFKEFIELNEDLLV